MKKFLSFNRVNLSLKPLILFTVFIILHSFTGKNLQAGMNFQNVPAKDTLPAKGLPLQIDQAGATNTNTNSDTSSAKSFDVYASFPGGASAWMRYLAKSMHVPEEAQRRRITGTIVVQFIVDVDGAVSNVETISGPTDAGLGREVKRIVKKSGKWIPAFHNGVPVKSTKTQPFTFKLDQ